jgi:hypothetical protein
MSDFTITSAQVEAMINLERSKGIFGSFMAMNSQVLSRWDAWTDGRKHGFIRTTPTMGGLPIIVDDTLGDGIQMRGNDKITVLASMGPIEEAAKSFLNNSGGFVIGVLCSECKGSGSQPENDWGECGCAACDDTGIEILEAKGYVHNGCDFVDGHRYKAVDFAREAAHRAICVYGVDKALVFGLFQNLLAAFESATLLVVEVRKRPTPIPWPPKENIEAQ